MDVQKVVERERGRLAGFIAVGLPPVYCGKLEEFAHDWWPDFSWDENSIDEMEAVLADPEWRGLARTLKQMRGYDMEALLRAGIEAQNEID